MSHRLPRRLGRFRPALVLWLASPVGAHAHNSIPGMDEFANGFLHPLFTPAQILIIIGLGLLLGRQRQLRLKIPLAVFLPVSALGLLMTAMGLVKVMPPGWLAVVSLGAGILIAIAIDLPAWATAVLFASAALVLSLDSVADGAASPWAVTKTLLGTWVSFIVWIIDIAFYVSLLPRKKWLDTGIRLGGSWIVATSFLLLAFALKR